MGQVFWVFCVLFPTDNILRSNVKRICTPSYLGVDFIGMKTRVRVNKHHNKINPCSQFWEVLICQTEIQTGVVRTGMGSVYKVDWSHKCLSPGGNL